MTGVEEVYQVKLPAFEGPLDLLLYLIKNKELEIEEVSISLITADFLHFVEEFRQVGHTAMAEFLSMAATLLYIKSLHLLPFSQDSSLAEDELEDPRKALVYQLIEYQKARRMVGFLEVRQNALVALKKPNAQMDEIKARFSFTEASFKEILDLYLKFFRPIKNQLILDKLKKALVTVEEKILWLARALKKRAQISFFELTEKLCRGEVIVTFLASLEMAKQKKVMLYQEALFGDITIENGQRATDGEQEEIA